MVKSNEISVDGLVLATLVVKAVKGNLGLKWVVEQTGLKSSCISQRLRQLRENHPELAPYMKFAKGAKSGGKSKTKLDKQQLTEMQALIASLTGAPPAVIQENGVSMVQGEAITDAQRQQLGDALKQQNV
jgi:hypothetical protein